VRSPQGAGSCRQSCSAAERDRPLFRPSAGSRHELANSPRIPVGRAGEEVPCSRQHPDEAERWGWHRQRARVRTPGVSCASAVTHSEGSGVRRTLARMALADLVHTKGRGLLLCSAM
jgi:hypothetical protein